MTHVPRIRPTLPALICALLIYGGGIAFGRDRLEIWTLKDNLVHVSAEVMSESLEHNAKDCVVVTETLVRKVNTVAARDHFLRDVLSSVRPEDIAFFDRTKPFVFYSRGERKWYLVEFELSQKRCKLGPLQRIAGQCFVLSAFTRESRDQELLSILRQALARLP